MPKKPTLNKFIYSAATDPEYENIDFVDEERMIFELKLVRKPRGRGYENTPKSYQRIFEDWEKLKGREYDPTASKNRMLSSLNISPYFEKKHSSCFCVRYRFCTSEEIEKNKEEKKKKEKNKSKEKVKQNIKQTSEILKKKEKKKNKSQQRVMQNMKKTLDSTSVNAEEAETMSEETEFYASADSTSVNAEEAETMSEETEFYASAEMKPTVLAALMNVDDCNEEYFDASPFDTSGLPEPEILDTYMDIGEILESLDSSPTSMHGICLQVTAKKNSSL